jgi:hypothetical protein
MSPVPLPPPVPARRRTLPLLLLALLVAVASLSGCARVRAALAVQPDDTVAGEIVLATPRQGPDDTGPQVTPPPELDGVEVSDYAQDGYVGSVLRFSGLTFEQVGLLPETAGTAGERVRLGIRRAGGRVIVVGSADLTTVPVDRADFQLKISFPGEVVQTNGDADSGTVSWAFDAGEVGDISAVVAFDDPQAPSAVSWTLLLAGLVALAAGAVVLLAHRTRNPPVSPPVR